MVIPLGLKQKSQMKARWELQKEAELTNHGRSRCMAIYLRSHKSLKKSEQDMLGTAGEVRLNL